MRFLVAVATILGVTLTAHAGAYDYFPETAKDFGTTPRGPMLTHYFPVKNNSNQTINLGSPRVSCGCVSAQVLKYTLAPGESSAVVANMDSRRIPQAGVPRTVTIFVPVQSGLVSEEMQLRVTAIARDDLVLSNDQFAFGTVRKGAGGKSQTKITFYSDANWQVTEAQSSGIYIKPEVKPVAKANPGEPTAFEITAALDPACPVGNWTADVWLKTTAAGIPNIRIPVSVNVIAPIDIKMEASALAAMIEGKSTEQRIILQATQQFKILEVKGAEGAVSVTKPAPAARPVHVLTATITPEKAGDFAQTIEVVTDHPDMPSVSIPLVGKVNPAAESK